MSYRKFYSFVFVIFMSVAFVFAFKPRSEVTLNNKVEYKPKFKVGDCIGYFYQDEFMAEPERYTDVVYKIYKVGKKEYLTYRPHLSEDQIKDLEKNPAEATEYGIRSTLDIADTDSSDYRLVECKE